MRYINILACGMAVCLVSGAAAFPANASGIYPGALSGVTPAPPTDLTTPPSDSPGGPSGQAQAAAISNPQFMPTEASSAARTMQYLAGNTAANRASVDEPSDTAPGTISSAPVASVSVAEAAPPFSAHISAMTPDSPPDMGEPAPMPSGNTAGEQIPVSVPAPLSPPTPSSTPAPAMTAAASVDAANTAAPATSSTPCQDGGANLHDCLKKAADDSAATLESMQVAQMKAVHKGDNWRENNRMAQTLAASVMSFDAYKDSECLRQQQNAASDRHADDVQLACQVRLTQARIQMIQIQPETAAAPPATAQPPLTNE